MLIRLIKPHFINPAGTILDVDMPIAELLIGRNVAVAELPVVRNVAEKIIGTETICGPVDKCKSRPRKPGRPRKPVF